ncbi:hypothetical protein BH23BAC4_BH23BAC4_16210 [soil metagenome]
MPDRNRLNASYPRGLFDVPLRGGFGFGGPQPSRDRAGVAVAPYPAYASDYGFGGGLRALWQSPWNEFSGKVALTVYPGALGEGDAILDSGHRLRGAPLDGLDYRLELNRALPALGPLSWATLDSRKQLGILDTRISAEHVLGGYPSLAPTRRSVEVTFGYQHRYSDRSFVAGRPLGWRTYNWPEPWGQEVEDFLTIVMPVDHVARTGFTQQPLLFAGLRYRTEDVTGSFVQMRLETGGTVPFDDYLQLGGGTRYQSDPSGLTFLHQNANRVEVAALLNRALIPGVTARASLLGALGSRNLVPQRRYGLGEATAEDRWLHQAFRASFSALRDEGSDGLRGFGFAGPVAYIEAAQPAVGTSVAAGSLSLDWTPMPRDRWLAPLAFEAFSGVGRVWNATMPAWRSHNGFVADAGLGVRYEASRAAGLASLTAGSEFLQTLDLSFRVPFWVSHPELISADEPALRFRPMVGFNVGL